MHKIRNESIKSTIIIGYILLFLVGAVSITFLYREVHQAKKPNDEYSIRNQQLINLSAGLSKLYIAEISGNQHYNFESNEVSEYDIMIDSAIYTLNKIKLNYKHSQNIKLDSISILLNKKKLSLSKLKELNQKYLNLSNSTSIKKRVSKLKDSIESNLIRYAGPKTEIVNDNDDFFSSLLNQKKLDSLNSLQFNYSDLISNFNKILTTAILKEDELRKELLLEENRIQQENQIISHKIQILVQDIEKEIRTDTSYVFDKSQSELEQTTKILLWVGIVGVFLIVLFGYIILSDLNKQQDYRNALEDLNTDNTGLLKSKTMLLATVTHDLQTPLGAIKGFSELLSQTNLTKKQSNYLKNVINASEYINNLINDLTDFSKLENNKIKINKTNFNLKDMLLSLFFTLKPIADEKEIDLFFSYKESDDLNIISDPHRLKQILMNLLTNAIKFTQKGKVKLKCKIINNELLFTVSDTGIGISKEQQIQIFEAFTQANSNIEEKFGGTGLGLTISKSFTQLIGGDIWVESTIGQGSTFYLKIPLIINDSSVEVFTNQKVNPKFLKNKKIIIVDDDKIQLELMQTLFSKFTDTVTLLNDATKVIPLLEVEDFDLLISDIQMPKKSGFELISKIRNHKNKNVSEILAIALSGKRDLSLEEYIEKGFNYYLSKPLNMNEALSVIGKLFNETLEYLPLDEVIHSQSDNLYNVKQLLEFIPDDPETLKRVIEVFVENTYLTIEEFQESKNNIEKTRQISHRILPMTKQLEINKIIPILEAIEYKSINENDLNSSIDIVTSHLLIVIKQMEIDFLQQ